MDRAPEGYYAYYARRVLTLVCIYYTGYPMHNALTTLRFVSCVLFHCAWAPGGKTRRGETNLTSSYLNPVLCLSPLSHCPTVTCKYFYIKTLKEELTRPGQLTYQLTDKRHDSINRDIANFSKNQIFGSASSYGNSASSKNTSSELAEFAPELAEFAREFAGKVFCASWWWFIVSILPTSNHRFSIFTVLSLS